MADAVSDISVQTVPMRIRRDTVWSHAVSDISVQTVPMHAQNVLPSCFLISLLLLFSPPFFCGDYHVRYSETRDARRET